MADVKLDLDDNPAVKVLLSQLRRDPPGQPTDNRLTQSLKNTGIPYLAISAIGNALAGSTIKVKLRDSMGGPVLKSNSQSNSQQRDDELREAPASHPLVKFFQRINPNDTFEDVMMDITIQYNLTGTAPLFLVPSRLGPPCEMWVLPTALMVSVPISVEYPEGAWRIQQYYPAGMSGIIPHMNHGAGVLVDGRFIKRFRKRHPLWRWDGYSPLTAGAVQLDVLNAIDESRKSAMDHGFNPDAVVTIEGVNQDGLERVKTQFENRHAGSRNSRKVIFVNGKAVNVENLSTNPKEMDYGSGWDQMVKYALGLFGVPPGTAGIAEATSYAQLYASLRQFYTLQMQPMAKALGAFLTKHVAVDVDPNAVVQIDVPEIDDKEFEKSKWDSAAQNNAVTLNEYRGYMSLPAMPDGDRMIGDPSPAQQAAEAAANQDPNAPQPGEPQNPEEAVTGSVLGMLGVDPNGVGGDEPGMVPGGQPAVTKRLQWDENKHKRNHGKFAHTAGAGGNTAQRQPAGKRATPTGGTPTTGGPKIAKPYTGQRENADLEAFFGSSGNEPEPEKVAFAQAKPKMAGVTGGIQVGQNAKYIPTAQPVPGLVNHFSKMPTHGGDVSAWAKAIKFPAAVVSSVKQMFAKFKAAGMDIEEMSRSNEWAVNAAKKHAGMVAAKLGRDPRHTERALYHMFAKMAQAVAGGADGAKGNVAGVGTFSLRKKQTQQSQPATPAAKQKPFDRSSLDALFKSEPALVEILKSL
jgi:hypothetical protein